MNVGRGGALTALVLLVAIGCGGSDAPPQNQGGGGTVVVDLPDGGKTEAPAPPAPPPPDGKPVDGIFVSSSKGVAGADGSRKRPVKTLDEAIKLALQKRPLPIIACAETYTEAVKLPDGVTMFGYFDCSDLDNWKRIKDARAVIASPTSPAVVAEGLTLPAYFEGFEVVGGDVAAPPSADLPAASSFGMIIKASANLSLSEVILRGGRGQDGADGVEPSANEQLGAPNGESGGVQGIINTCTVGGVYVCTDPEFLPGGAGGTSKCKVGAKGGDGGKGGDGRYFDPGPGSGGMWAGSPTTANANTERGGAEVGTSGSSTGQAGKKGVGGNAGSNGTWRFDSAGFVPGAGTAGADGGPGQGGGGGGGSRWFVCNAAFEVCSPQSPTNKFFAAQGGGGGAGGCGGLAGTPGKGGGASVGLLVVASKNLSIKASRIEGGTGGKGGKGALGTTGTPGGTPGNGGTTGATYERGGVGGAGGPGGDGGPSGHGAPGPSIALVFSGDRPFLEVGVELVPGQAGAGQAAMVRGEKVVPAAVGQALKETSF